MDGLDQANLDQANQASFSDGDFNSPDGIIETANDFLRKLKWFAKQPRKGFSNQVCQNALFCRLSEHFLNFSLLTLRSQLLSLDGR